MLHASAFDIVRLLVRFLRVLCSIFGPSRLDDVNGRLYWVYFYLSFHHYHAPSVGILVPSFSVATQYVASGHF